MIRKRIVALDVDGVLANFYLAICQKFGKPYDVVTSWGIDWINQNFKEIKTDSDFWLLLPLLNVPYSINFQFDYYVSSFPIEMMKERERWLEMYGFPNKPLIQSDDKVKTAKELGITTIIDDKPSTIIDFVNNGLEGVMYVPYYFDDIMIPKNVPFIRHLPEFNKIIKNYYD